MPLTWGVVNGDPSAVRNTSTCSKKEITKHRTTAVEAGYISEAMRKHDANAMQLTDQPEHFARIANNEVDGLEISAVVCEERGRVVLAGVRLRRGGSYLHRLEFIFRKLIRVCLQVRDRLGRVYYDSFLCFVIGEFIGDCVRLGSDLPALWWHLRLGFPRCLRLVVRSYGEREGSPCLFLFRNYADDDNNATANSSSRMLSGRAGGLICPLAVVRPSREITRHQAGPDISMLFDDFPPLCSRVFVVRVFAAEIEKARSGPDV